MTHGKDILIAETAAEFIETAAALQQDTPLWHELRANGLRLVQAEYDWSVVGERLLGIYRQTARQTPGSERRRGWRNEIESLKLGH